MSVNIASAKELAQALLDTAAVYEANFDHSALQDMTQQVPLTSIKALYRKTFLECANDTAPAFSAVLKTLLETDYTQNLLWARTVLQLPDDVPALSTNPISLIPSVPVGG